MDIAITGHRHGLGQAIYNKLLYYNKGAGNKVLGFDIEDGYDISIKLRMGKVLFYSRNCDVFINNAYHPTGQTEMLKFLLKMWKGKKKTIVNIGTFYVNQKDTSWITSDKLQEYLDQKTMQKEMLDNFVDDDLKIIQVNPGIMKTEFLDKINPGWEAKHLLNVVDCADAIISALDLLKKNIYIPEIDLLDKRWYN